MLRKLTIMMFFGFLFTRMAEEPGLDYQCHFTDVMSAEKQVPGKNQKVPALSDDGLVIFESSAICIYLAQTCGNGRFSACK